MNRSNVKLIFCREVRDQLRDRRTLFMIVVLPLFLYPLLGMSLFQVAQFIREQPTRVLVIGAEALPKAPTLIDGDRFATRLFSEPDKVRLVELHFLDRDEAGPTDEHVRLRARLGVERGEYEAAVFVPPDFGDQLDTFRRRLSEDADNGTRGSANDKPTQVPSPEIFFNAAKEKSQLAELRVSRILDRWTEEIGRQNLKTSHLPESTAKPFDLAEHDVAAEGQRKAVVWSKILPFMLLVWALTGAFYPAVDLCAGEKERGTLETLLSSPAERSEIVWGKLLTVMLFSVVTAMLNILSMALTGSIVMSQLPEVGPPPAFALVWLTLALLPISALYSAVCLALAAFARSTKEGQYYLMPVLLITMPLVLLPMAPGVELNLGNSLIPITGVVLLLRTMLEGEFWQALPFIGPVVAVTLACCLFAIRWAIDQFNSESVLFRESERWDIGLYFKHLLRDREDMPSAFEAVFCGVLILLIRFFMSFALPQPQSFRDVAVMTVVTQLVMIGTPALLMAVMLTRRPARTLGLCWPGMLSIPAAVALAVTLHPALLAINQIVQQLYPVSENVRSQLSGLLAESPDLWQLIILLGVIPAVFEELAFRGFMLSGFRRLGHKWRAIVLASFFFAVTHAVFQQSITAFLIGLLLGYICVQSGSVLPGIFYHAVHNSLALGSAYVDSSTIEQHPWLKPLVTVGDHGVQYSWPVMIACGLAAMLLLAWFHGRSYSKTSEEKLQEAIEHHTTQPVVV